MYNKYKLSFYLFLYFETFAFVFQTPLIAQKYEVTLFEDAHFDGKCMRLSVKTNECTNLSAEWLNKTSSILTNGCVVIYSDFDCKSGNHEFFSSINFYFYDSFLSVPGEIPNYDFSSTR